MLRSCESVATPQVAVPNLPYGETTGLRGFGSCSYRQREEATYPRLNSFAYPFHVPSLSLRKLVSDADPTPNPSRHANHAL